jgi:UDP-N-acetylglucosamine 4,6-dehydratase
MPYRMQELRRKVSIPLSAMCYWPMACAAFVKPARRSGGQRRYAEEGMAAVRQIKEMVHENHN